MLIDDINALRIQTNNGVFKFIPGKLERGTGIAICSGKPPERDDGIKIVITHDHGYEIHCVVFNLKEIFKNELDFLNQFIFYARLADRAINYIEENGDNAGVNIAIIDEAEKMAIELVKNGDLDTSTLKIERPNSFLSKVINAKSTDVVTIGSRASYDKCHGIKSLYLDSDCPPELIEFIEAWGCKVQNYSYFKPSWPIKYEKITFRYKDVSYSMRGNVIGVDSELFYEMAEDIANDLVLMGAEDVFVGGMLD